MCSWVMRLFAARRNAQQWYVTISRGRTSVHIFTPDKAGLRKQITRSGDRDLALDLDAGKRERRAIQRGLLHTLRRGRAFAKAVALMFARKRSMKTRETNRERYEPQTILQRFRKPASCDRGQRARMLASRT